MKGKKGTGKNKAKETKLVPVPRTNADLVRNLLAKLHPEMAERLSECDHAFICNRFLLSDRDKECVAEALGLDRSRCSLCTSSVKEDECSHFKFPLNNCRNGLLEWLGSEITETG